ncbi:MAG: phosphoglycerate mutase family protein [Eubacteriales bacterium]|nr:phosphoglycerate mutase family protein [Eubacteriales bacterium]
MEIYLIRHGKTYGNSLSRYIGVTDEPLCESGIEELKAIAVGEQYPRLSRVYTSDLKRTIETAKILFPDADRKIVNDLRECDFGEFENKNYKELDGNENYQKWVDSNGELPFPGGESREDCLKRQVNAFFQCIRELEAEKIDQAGFVVHGGTIMHIMEALCTINKKFYEWHVGNGAGYHVKILKSQNNILNNKSAFIKGLLNSLEYQIELIQS